MALTHLDDRSLISVLSRDHRRIRELLVRLTVRGPDRRELAAELTRVVRRHIVAEELFLYPVVCEIVPVRAADATRHVRGDVRIEQILADLAGAEPAGHAFDVLVTRLVVEVRQAIFYEELQVFPWLARRGDRLLLAELGDGFQAYDHVALDE